MDWSDVLVVVIIGLCVIFAIRNHMVYKLRTRVLKEESDWLTEHVEEFKDGKREWGLFRRYMRLPPYEVMLFQFWRLVSSYEEKLGPIEKYYPLI